MLPIPITGHNKNLIMKLICHEKYLWKILSITRINIIQNIILHHSSRGNSYVLMGRYARQPFFNRLIYLSACMYMFILERIFNQNFIKLRNKKSRKSLNTIFFFFFFLYQLCWCGRLFVIDKKKKKKMMSEVNNQKTLINSTIVKNVMNFCVWKTVQKILHSWVSHNRLGFFFYFFFIQKIKILEQYCLVE